MDKTYILSIAYGHCIPKPVNGVRRRFTCDPLQQKVSYAFWGLNPLTNPARLQTEYSVFCRSVGVSVCHSCEPCKNG